MTPNYEERARALVGTRFRPQGRSTEGLDCVGLILATYDIDANGVRRDYRLRGDHGAEIERALLDHFRRIPSSQKRPGDLMLLSIAIDQLHLAVLSVLGFIHAHAGIGRVVETPGAPEWPLIGTYRKRAHKRSN